MSIELKGHKISDLTLVNRIKGESVQLEFGFGYKCKFDVAGTDNATAELRIAINSMEGGEKPENAEVFIRFCMEAVFDITDEDDEAFVEKETLRLLFPVAQAFVIQLTSLSQMTPLYLPPMRENVLQVNEKSASKSGSRNKKSKPSST